MKVFVTGASGFLGAHVIRRLLNEGCEVAVLVRSGGRPWRLQDVFERLRVFRGDLSRYDGWQDSLRRWRPEACIHLAWYVEPGKYLHASENLLSMQASLSLLNHLVEIGCGRIVMVGTCAEYAPQDGELDEDAPTHATTLYAATKLCTGILGRQLAADAGVPFAWARVFHPYGPYEDRRRVLPALLGALRRGERFPATSGEQVRDYIYAEDVAGALWHVVEHGLTGVYNVCSGVPVTMRRMMETLAQIAVGTAMPVDFGALRFQSWDPPVIRGNNERLRATGWQPRYSLAAGLNETVRWWQQHTD